jgi:hypothetical protein
MTPSMKQPVAQPHWPPQQVWSRFGPQMDPSDNGDTVCRPEETSSHRAKRKLERLPLGNGKGAGESIESGFVHVVPSISGPEACCQ